MKIISWTLITLLTLTATSAFAQYADDNVTVNDSRKSKDPFKGKNKAQDLDSGKISKISLPDPDVNMENVSSTGIEISGIQIINEVSDSSVLGYVQTGMFNRWKPAGFEKPFTDYLQSYLDQHYRSIFKKEGPQLLIVVQEIRIGERTFSMSERGFCQLKAITFAGDGNGKFRQITTLDTILTRGGLDVTHKHGENIAAALHLLLVKSGKTTQAGNNAYTIPEIRENAAKRYNVPGLQAKEHPDGIYLTFQEFIDDRPSITTFEFTTNSDKVTQFYQKDSSGKIRYIDKFWGVRKSGALLKQHYDASLIPIEQKQNSIYLVNYLANSRRNNNALIWSSVGGGLIGGAIAAGSMAGTMPFVENIPYIKKKEPFATRIDIETGELSL